MFVALSGSFMLRILSQNSHYAYAALSVIMLHIQNVVAESKPDHRLKPSNQKNRPSSILIQPSATSTFLVLTSSPSLLPHSLRQHNTHVAETSKNLRSMKLWNLCFGVSSKDGRRKAELPAEDERDENGVASSTPTDPSAVVRERELHFDKIYFEIRFTQHNILLTQSPHRHTICTHNREKKEIEKSKNVKRINKIEWMNDFLITVKSDSTLRRAARSRRKPCNKIEWRRSSSRARSRVLIEKLWDDEKWF